MNEYYTWDEQQGITCGEIQAQWCQPDYWTRLCTARQMQSTR